MNILYTLNDKFVPQVAGGICSICENNKDVDDINFYLISNGISEKNTHLTVGNYTYDCVFEGNTFTIVKKQYFQFNREKYFLKFFNLTLEIE